MGVQVVELDMGRPFTAARARNQGWKALLRIAPDIEFVQFIDGDCAIVPEWVLKAKAFLCSKTRVAVAVGRLMERFPDASIYNRLCDIEWNGPLGEVNACGGIAMIRALALQEVRGFRDDLIAGEEPEMCVRLRKAGWRIHRLDADMAWHDAAMTRFGQWWKRAVRGGYAFAEGAWLHGGPPERHWVRETLRALFWGAAFPLAVLLLALWVSLWFLSLLLAYPVQVVRLSGGPGGWTRAWFLVLGKFAEAWGALKFYSNTLRKRKNPLMEYK
jgi:GT2 family glycosyltransferase